MDGSDPLLPVLALRQPAAARFAKPSIVARIADPRNAQLYARAQRAYAAANNRLVALPAVTAAELSRAGPGGADVLTDTSSIASSHYLRHVMFAAETTERVAMTVAPTPHRAAHQCHHIAMIGDVTVRELVRRSRVVNRTVKDMQSIATAGERQPFPFDHARIPYFLTAPARDWTFLMLHDRLAWGVRVGMLICPMCFAPTATHRSYHVVHECPIAQSTWDR